MPYGSPPLTARPTVYRGVQMRSRLEARYAQWLDKIGADWLYEPQCFADETGQYLPDFVIRGVGVLSSPRDVYVELKPTPEHAAPVTRDQRMERIWSAAPEAALAIECPGFWATGVQLHGVHGWSPYQWAETDAGLILTPATLTLERTWTQT